jgi:hypothetical protein
MKPPERDLARSAVVTLIPTGLGFVLAGPVVGAACLFVAFVISLVLWTPLGAWLGLGSKVGHDPSRAPNIAYRGSKDSKADLSRADFDFSHNLGVGIETDGEVDASHAKFH